MPTRLFSNEAHIIDSSAGIEGVALVPNAMARLAPDNVIVTLLQEKIVVVTSAMAWNSQRHCPMIHIVKELLAEPLSLEQSGP